MWEYKYQKDKPESAFNIQTVEIIKKHCKDYHSVLEIGAGRGEISKLLYQPGISLMAMDSSESSCKYMSKYFEDNKIKATIIKGDVFQFYKQKYEPTFGLVVSSGLIEHFKGEQLKLLVEIHKAYSMKFIVCVVPNSTPAEIEFAESEKCKKQYGYQSCFTPEDLNKLFVDDKWKAIHNEVFYTADKLLIGIYKKI